MVPSKPRHAMGMGRQAHFGKLRGKGSFLLPWHCFPFPGCSGEVRPSSSTQDITLHPFSAVLHRPIFQAVTQAHLLQGTAKRV